MDKISSNACRVSFAFVAFAERNKKRIKPFQEPYTGFVTFKVDGKKYRIDDVSLGLGFFGGGEDYQFFAAAFSPRNRKRMMLLQHVSPSGFRLGKYHYNAFSVMEFSMFNYVLTGGKKAYLFDIAKGTGCFEFTHLDMHCGGMVQGLFNFNNVNLVDKEQKIISSGHTVTDGRFTIIVDTIEQNN